MDLQAEKLSLVQAILDIEDISLIKKVKKIFIKSFGLYNKSFCNTIDEKSCKKPTQSKRLAYQKKVDLVKISNVYDNSYLSKKK